MSARMRPLFLIRVALSADVVRERMRESLKRDRVPWQVALLNGQIEVSPRVEDLHFWSPYLKIRLVEKAADITELRGKFGPNINLWTLLVAIYAVCGLLGATGLLVAVSQWQLNQPLTGLWVAVGCLLVSGIVWLIGQIGQRWAQSQMQGIHAFISETYEDAIVEDRTEAI